MSASRRSFLGGTAVAALAVAVAPKARAQARAATASLTVSTPMPAPGWALLQRQLLADNAEACAAFYARYFDERGYFLCFERWGANDGPDDAIENVNNWPLLHALGGADRVKAMYTQAWEGHLKQYTAAKTTEVAIAREGMFFKEFNVQLDWQHHAEELTMFNVQGLSDPNNPRFADRARRFSALYMGEDADAPNYDPQHKIIKSLMNGSRGPMLRKATALDWAGDPFEAGHRFFMEHGETTYEQTLHHYDEYTDVVGDHPLNLFSTTLALNAYMLAQEPKYRDWLLGYVDAWIERAKANDDLLPSNVGLDGVIGSSADGKWWGGTYGWGFSPVNPVTGKREDRSRVLRTILGFFNAYLLTGDDKYLDVWRKQADRLNREKRTVDGKVQTPTMYNADGWYGWKDGLHQLNSLDIWWFSMKPSDRARAPDHPWVAFLEGRNPDFPETALRKDLARVAEMAKAEREDTTTPDTRLADARLEFNPASVSSLMQTMMGALHIGRPPWGPTTANAGGSPLYARLRYFDAEARRAGVPEDVAALIDSMTADETAVTLVNLSPTQSREVIIQGGGYGEHTIKTATFDGKTQAVNASAFTLKLAPGAGTRVVLAMDRYVNQPTLNFPWDR
ncbi:hypothetical protein [Brevundimonas goettingensis]|uniref:Twin-arginine translocation signal domain-containing protein n=1 Tax=Brevundimonas goettingensis TaxID=2774190 RepID=A0A975GZ55_9CAUL|nr:hypothetical protein [Brevundimonas goettingensis]QTC92305.1 hypothetical protein IFJ75_05270 [Brevundimonas goettingensis]